MLPLRLVAGHAVTRLQMAGWRSVRSVGTVGTVGIVGTVGTVGR